MIRIVLQSQRKIFQILLNQKEHFCNTIIIDSTDCPNTGEFVLNGACVCANTGETVKNGTCVCNNTGEFVQNRACACLAPEVPQNGACEG